ncbi:hypothetical protein B0G77_5545 [Paraburkholderia sp. BL10I2N1]|nr:hypothetical protein B0G77_5545 [Paraburkholderia sp. BL10I2N1]
MLFLEKNAATELIERKDHALEHVGFDGEKRTYFPARSMWLRLEQLHVAQQLAEPLDADKQPTLSTSLHGVAHLDGQELSIIGDAGHAMHTVEVSFEARDVSTADRLGLRELEDELGISFSDVPLGTATPENPISGGSPAIFPKPVYRRFRRRCLMASLARSSWGWRCGTSTRTKVPWLTLSASRTFFSSPTKATAQLNGRKSQLAMSPTFVLTSQLLSCVPPRRAAAAMMN